jgi:hypothetical protein
MKLVARCYAQRRRDMQIITTLLTGVGLLLTMGTAHAQSLKTDNTTNTTAQITDLEVSLMRKDLRDQKKQVVVANLPLNGDEAAGFWPLYDA